MSKKVLFIATVVQKHINVFHLPYLKMFQEEGYTTYVAAANDTDKTDVVIPYCDEYIEIKFERNPLSLKNIFAYQKLKKLIRDKEFDIIHCHTPVGGLLGRLAARKSRKNGTTVFYTAHGFHFYKGAPLKNWLCYYPVEKLCSYFTDVLITINQEDYLLAQKRMKAKQVEYVHGVGIDCSKFMNTTIDIDKKREEIGIEKGVFLLISVGEISKRKNHKRILEALSKINDKKIHYMIVGNGPLQKELENFICEHKMADQVHFLGYRNDVAELYKISDACCFPSIHEGLPVALMEAMACGVPIICSKIRGNVDLLNERSGILVDLDEEDGFETAIRIMKSNIIFRSESRKYNMKNILAYSEEVVLDEMKNLYLNIN